jgi:hypothetical protein
MNCPFFVASLGCRANPALSQGIVTARMKRMALQQPFDAEKAAFEKSIAFQRLNKIGGTAGVKPADGRKQR